MSLDPQKMRLYRWEQQHVAPLDPTNVPFNYLQSIVDYVWKDQGLEFPPKVEKLPKQNKKCTADACRMTIRVKAEGCPTWVLLHEIAHSMTSNFEGYSHHHGPEFVWVYVKLICKYLPGVNQLILRASLKANYVMIKE